MQIKHKDDKYALDVMPWSLSIKYLVDSIFSENKLQIGSCMVKSSAKYED